MFWAKNKFVVLSKFVPNSAPEIFSLNLHTRCDTINHFTVIKYVDILSLFVKEEPMIMSGELSWVGGWNKPYITTIVQLASVIIIISIIFKALPLLLNILCFYSVSCSLNSLCCFMQIIKYFDWIIQEQDGSVSSGEDWNDLLTSYRWGASQVVIVILADFYLNWTVRFI